MRRAIKVLAPDLVVAHGGEAAKYSVFAVKRATPLVYLNIGSMHPGLGRRRGSFLHHYYTRRADVVVAVSRFLADEATGRSGIPAGKVVVIPNGRDASVFGPSASREPGEQVRLIWIGQLDETKRPELMIELVRVLRSEGFEIEARIVGDGPRRADLAGSSRAAGVAMMGRRDDVPLLLRDSDILVFTGRPPEGMPGVLIEAGLCGVAAVSTRVPGSDEVIQDRVTGLLVDIDDVSGLIDSVRNLALDAEARERMGRNARLRCLEHFSFEATSVMWRELFSRLLGHATSPA
jgi:glycosyltransferase involved in cell wall biosynthesis